MASEQISHFVKNLKYCAPSKKLCYFCLVGYGLTIFTVLAVQCYYTNQCSLYHVKELVPTYRNNKQVFGINIRPSRPAGLGDLLNQSCEPLHPQGVFYNRIFKAASTTMSSFLKKSSRILNNKYTTDLTEEWENENISHPVVTRIKSAIEQSKRTNRRLMAIAHSYFRKDVESTYINLLREPVARFVSHYYYCRSPLRWPINVERLKKLGHFNVTLEECIENQYEGCVWNHMTRFFCGPQAFCKTGSQDALARAKHNMIHYYASVGVMEYLDAFVGVLNKRLPEFVLPPPKTGMIKTFVTKGVKKKPIAESTMQRLREVNKADIDLYEFAKKIFFKQAKNCGIKFKL